MKIYLTPHTQPTRASTLSYSIDPVPKFIFDVVTKLFVKTALSVLDKLNLGIKPHESVQDIVDFYNNFLITDPYSLSQPIKTNIVYEADAINTMSKKTNNQRRVKPKRVNKSRANSALSPSFQRFRTSGLSDVIPISTMVALRFTDPTVVRLATGLPWNLFSLRANDVWDPDVALLSAAISGFREWSAFYQKWRVHKVRVEWEVVNTSNAPISFYVNYASDINTIPANFAAAVSFADNPTSSIVKTVSQNATGANKAKIVFHFDLARQYDTAAEFMANENFVGNGGASPTSPGARTFLNFIAFSSGNMTTGIYSRLKVTYFTNFFDRIPLVT